MQRQVCSGVAVDRQKNLKKQKGLRNVRNPLYLFGSGGWIRTSGLRVMSPTSFQAAPPRVIFYK